MKLGLVRGRVAAWTATRFREEGGELREEATTGFASLAPEGAQDYTARARRGADVEEVARGRNADDVTLPEGSTGVAVEGLSGAVTLATPTLRDGGGFRCKDFAVRTYFGVDHLGTVRYTKTYDYFHNEVSTSTHDYEPFGVELPGKDGCGNTHQFTGHERDVETGNDYMHFRMFASNMGRFMKPDSVFDGASQNPQGFNLYSYVHGNPVNFNDPTGHAPNIPIASGKSLANLTKQTLLGGFLMNMMDFAFGPYGGGTTSATIQTSQEPETQGQPLPPALQAQPKAEVAAAPTGTFEANSFVKKPCEYYVDLNDQKVIDVVYHSGEEADYQNPPGTPDEYLNQCVSLTKELAKVPQTDTWRAGRPLGPDVPPGTAIATFDENGRYPVGDDVPQNSGIYMGMYKGQPQILDQWPGHPPEVRGLTVGHTFSNDPNNYRTITTFLENCGGN